MLKNLLSATLLLSLSTPMVLHAAKLSNEEKLSDLNQLASVIRSGYGPLEYKKTLGIDLEKILKTYTAKTLATKNNGEFYYLLRQFIAEFKDSHFQGAIPTFKRADLGIDLEWVDGKVLIEQFDFSLLGFQAFILGRQYVKGDEVLAINGRSVQELINEMEPYVSSGYDLTRKHSATYLLTSKSATQVPLPKESAAQLIVKKRETGEIVTLDLDWKVRGIALDEEDKGNKFAQINPLDLSTKEYWTDLMGKRIEQSFQCSGSTRWDIPKDAKVIMTEPFVAYIQPTIKGDIGYLRIPHYSPEDTDQEFKRYEYAINTLEQKTVGLIIDQNHNCGGSVTYLEDLLGLFMDKPYAPTPFKFRGSRQNLVDWQLYSLYSDPNTMEKSAIDSVLEDIKEAFTSGNFLTKTTAFRGKETLLYPNRIRYTKPILVLIDEMSGSGGDAFPALMKGYGRAKLFGERTMGAGGNVTPEAPLNYSRLRFNMTKSLFYRPDGVPVENNGAVPDIKYTVTQKDFAEDYVDYQAAMKKAMLDMIK